MKAYEYTSPFQAGVPTKLALFSDIHFDSPDCDQDTFKDHLNYCLKDQRYMLFGGDFFDAILLKDQKRAVNHLMERTDNQINVKLEEAAHFLSPYKDYILFMGRGNHEESILKYNGLDMLQLLVALLNGGKTDKIQYGNYSNFLRFSWIKGKYPAVHYTIYQTHGLGANSPVSKGAIDFNRILHGTDADLAWCGHKHNSLFLASDPLMTINQDGEVIMKNRQAIMTPSYQKRATIDSNVNFAERFYTHQSMPGFGEVTLTPYYDGKYPALKKDVKLNINPGAVVGKILSQKIKQKVR